MRAFKGWNIIGRSLAGIILIISFVFSEHSPASGAILTQLTLACGAPSDACWEKGFHLPGVTGNVYAMAKDTFGNIYVGGEISSAGGIPVKNIAKWDGTAWFDLGGITRTSGTAYVAVLAMDNSGNLIAGGYFDTAGTTPANNIAKWNGSSWQALGTGTDGGIQAVEVGSGTDLYVGGSFDMAGTTPANNIAKWNGAIWSALGAGVSNGVDDTVYATELDAANNRLYVAGDFYNAGGMTATKIASFAFATSTWSPVGAGFTTGGTVYDLLLVPGSGSQYNLYAGGAFPEVDYKEAHGIARWDGAAWNAMAYGTGGAVNSMDVTASGELYVGGHFSTVGTGPAIPAKNIARWNGATWSALGAGLGTENYEEVSSVLVTSTDKVIAGGRFDETAGLRVNSLAKWDPVGSAWAGMDGGLGVNSTTNVLLPYGSSVFAAGGYTQAGPISVNGVAKLTGAAWTGFGSGASYFVRDLATSDGTNLYAGGAFANAGGVEAKNIAKWNGSAWSEVGGGTNGYVNVLALDGSGNLYVGGEFTTVGAAIPASHIARWNGTAWDPLGDGLDGNVEALAVDASGNLYAGGYFHYARSLYVSHIAMWDGAKWNTLGSGTSDFVLTLGFDSDGRLYAGGYFNTADGTIVNGVGMWNGSAWSPLGSGLNDGVGDLEVDANGYLYAGGDFNTAGGISANHVARWDGFSWSALGSGTDGNVRAMAVNSNRLIVGGVFNKAGGTASSYIGAYDFPPVVAAPVPSTVSLSPTSKAPGGAGFWLTVDGADFSSRSVVRWNGAALLTTYKGGNQLFAYVPADKITIRGSAVITVFTPAPSGGGVSNSRDFTIGDFRIFLPGVIR